MRRIVIAKMLILALWTLYLGMVLSQPVGHEFNDAAGVDNSNHKKCFPAFTQSENQRSEGGHPAGAGKGPIGNGRRPTSGGQPPRSDARS